MSNVNIESLTIYVVVLAWNHYSDTKECLQSIMRSEGVRINIILVDNGSTDETSTKVGLDFPNVILIKSQENRGVSGGYNLGIKEALRLGAEYVLIANNDIYIDSRMIYELVQRLVDDPKAGIAMPKIYHYFGDRNKIWTIGARWRNFPPMVKMLAYNVRDEAKYDLPRLIEFAPSCCYLLRSSLINKIGFFDEKYFFYFDDWDYSFRVIQSGFVIWFVPEAKMWHKVSLSTQKSDHPLPWWRFMGRSACRFYNKNYSQLQLILFAIWFICREMIKLKPVHSIGFIEGLIIESGKTKEIAN